MRICIRRNKAECLLNSVKHVHGIVQRVARNTSAKMCIAMEIHQGTREILGLLYLFKNQFLELCCNSRVGVNHLQKDIFYFYKQI